MMILFDCKIGIMDGMVPILLPYYIIFNPKNWKEDKLYCNS